MFLPGRRILLNLRPRAVYATARRALQITPFLRPHLKYFPHGFVYNGRWKTRLRKIVDFKSKLDYCSYMTYSHYCENFSN